MPANCQTSLPSSFGIRGVWRASTIDPKSERDVCAMATRLSLPLQFRDTCKCLDASSTLQLPWHSRKKHYDLREEFGGSRCFMATVSTVVFI